MAVVETWVRCELTESVKVHYLKGNVFSQDSQGNQIVVEVFKNDQPVTLSGSVNGYCVLADGSTVPVSGARNGNMATVTLLQACYAIPGPISIVVKLTDGNEITTLACVVGTVYQSKTDNMVTPSETVITDWSQQISETLQQCLDATAGTVKYSESQSLTDAQKTQARANIGAAGSGDVPTGFVSYAEQQSLTATQKAQARSNIGAPSTSDIISDPVRYSAQSLTDAQKAQARSNIGAISSSEVDSLGFYIADGYICQDISTD